MRASASSHFWFCLGAVLLPRFDKSANLKRIPFELEQGKMCFLENLLIVPCLFTMGAIIIGMFSPSGD